MFPAFLCLVSFFLGSVGRVPVAFGSPVHQDAAEHCLYRFLVSSEPGSEDTETD